MPSRRGLYPFESQFAKRSRFNDLETDLNHLAEVQISLMMDLKNMPVGPACIYMKKAPMAYKKNPWTYLGKEGGSFWIARDLFDIARQVILVTEKTLGG